MDAFEAEQQQKSDEPDVPTGNVTKPFAAEVVKNESTTGASLEMETVEPQHGSVDDGDRSSNQGASESAECAKMNSPASDASMMKTESTSKPPSSNVGWHTLFIEALKEFNPELLTLPAEIDDEEEGDDL